MRTFSTILVVLLALEHVWALVLEMFLWTKPYGRKAFGQTKEQAEATALLAKNQGLYNGFLAAGLAWGVAASGPEAFHVKLFFAACVLAAGLYGFATVRKTSILIGQGLLGGVAVAALLFVGAE